jgi:hypothetical protein
LNVVKILFFHSREPLIFFRFAAFVIGTAKIGGCRFPTKFFCLKITYLYWGVYWVLAGTSTRGLPL